MVKSFTRRHEPRGRTCAAPGRARRMRWMGPPSELTALMPPPLEVENVLSRHPDVAEVAVIGIPSARWGEEVKAVIVPRPGADLNDLPEWCAARLAKAKRPVRFERVDALPRTSVGKIRKFLLRSGE